MFTPTRIEQPEELVGRALRRVLVSRPPPARLLVHSDRGRQYGGNHCWRLLTEGDLVRSRSRKGECHAHAPAESLWSWVKTEVLRDRVAFASVSEAQAEVAPYFNF